MREILFKGKRVDDGKWVEGYYAYQKKSLTDKERYYILTNNGFGFSWQNIAPETLCQYSGLTDKNGKKIFEGDIIKYTDEIIDKEKITQIEYCEKQASFVRVYKSKMGLQYLYINERIANKSELIGNIFDNPELLTED